MREWRFLVVFLLDILILTVETEYVMMQLHMFCVW
jgi:hypothetical protein